MSWVDWNELFFGELAVIYHYVINQLGSSQKLKKKKI